MTVKIGIRREDKNPWERRTPIVPEHVKQLVDQFGCRFLVQPSTIRVFKESDYVSAGAEISEDMSSCDIICAVKEVPTKLLLPDKTYVYFSHTIKGQAYNMAMLQRLLDLKCTLLDYELFKDPQGKRLIFFGNYAGLAGMIDSFWALGQRLKTEGINTPFSDIRPAHAYGDLEEAKKALSEIGSRLHEQGIPDIINPLVIGFAGYGNVSKGAQEIFDLFPHKFIAAEEFDEFFSRQTHDQTVLYKVVFKEKDMFKPMDPAKDFDLQEYYSSPGLYKSIFHEYLPRLTVLMNCIYWTPRYPRIITKSFLKELYGTQAVLRVIGDITCDVEGAVEATLKCTTPDQPVFVYDVDLNTSRDGVTGNGPVILAVDHLPCELPKESSEFFSRSLLPYLPLIAQIDYSKSFEQITADTVVKNAIIAHKGKLTPAFDYLHDFLGK